jgi:hypothetical protein
MSVALKVLRQVNAVNSLETYIAATMSGNYTTGIGGDPCSLVASNIKDPNALSPSLPGQVPQVPPSVEQASIGGYTADLIQAATLSGFALKFWTSEGVELGSGAYPAAISGGTVTLKMIAPKGA